MAYVAVILLARRNHASAFGAGISLALIWNGLQLFVTHLMQAGARELSTLLRSGHVRRPEPGSLISDRARRNGGSSFLEASWLYHISL
jgi:hypothetical protein